jgi:hypothetical protein
MGDNLHRFFLLQKRGESYSRYFPPLDNNIALKVLLAAVLEQCIVNRQDGDLDFFYNYLLALRKKFSDKRFYDLDIVGTELFKTYLASDSGD